MVNKEQAEVFIRVRREFPAGEESGNTFLENRELRKENRWEIARSRGPHWEDKTILTKE